MVTGGKVQVRYANRRAWHVCWLVVYSGTWRSAHVLNAVIISKQLGGQNTGTGTGYWQSLSPALGSTKHRDRIPAVTVASPREHKTQGQGTGSHCRQP
jgi:hypothetical protein